MRYLAGLLLLAFPAYAEVPLAPFTPVVNGSVTISCGVASSATALTGLPSNFVSYDQVEVQNAGTVTVFVEPGSSSGVAAVVASSYPVLAGQSKVISVGRGTSHLACISGSGTQTVYATTGKGN